MRKLIIALAIAACLLAASAAEGRTSFEIIEFIDGRGPEAGTSTLIVECSDRRQIKVPFNKKQLERIDIGALYDRLDKECSS